VGTAAKVARQHFFAGVPPSEVAVHFVLTSAEANPTQPSVGIVETPQAHEVTVPKIPRRLAAAGVPVLPTIAVTAPDVPLLNLLQPFPL
jgi:hypothetical protein